MRPTKDRRKANTAGRGAQGTAGSLAQESAGAKQQERRGSSQTEDLPPCAVEAEAPQQPENGNAAAPAAAQKSTEDAEAPTVHWINFGSLQIQAPFETVTGDLGLILESEV